MEKQIQIISLGPEPLPYGDVRALQHQLVQLRSLDKIPDTVLFLEHTPVVTQGRGLQWTGESRPRHMPITQEVLKAKNIDFAESERGGDLTYHGPGQLVIYPILKTRDIVGTLRKLELTIIGWLESLGLEAKAHENATGVWVRQRTPLQTHSEPETPFKKIGSIGIAVRKWVTYHGAAINVVADLSPFHLISPCGFAPEVMTRLSDFLSPTEAAVKNENWRRLAETALVQKFLEVFEIPTEPNSSRPPVLSMNLAEARRRFPDEIFPNQRPQS